MRPFVLSCLLALAAGCETPQGSSASVPISGQTAAHDDTADAATAGAPAPDASAAGASAAGASAGGVAGTVADRPVIPPLVAVQRHEVMALVHGDGMFVAGGGSQGAGFIVASEDGEHWMPVASNLEATVRDIAYGNGRFVALGTEFSDTLSQAHVSEDGLEWTTVELEHMAIHFAFGDGEFIAAGPTGLYRSSDGLQWTLTDGPAIEAVGGIEFGGGVFLAWNLGEVAVQVFDGETWQMQFVSDEVGDLPVDGVRVVDDRFVVLSGGGGWGGAGVPGAAEPTYWVTSSEDGRFWTVGAFGLPGMEPSVAYHDDGACIALSYHYIHSGPDCGALQQTFGNLELRPEGALGVDGLYLVYATGPGPLSDTTFTGIFASHDALSWTKVF